MTNGVVKSCAVARSTSIIAALSSPFTATLLGILIVGSRLSRLTAMSIVILAVSNIQEPHLSCYHGKNSQGLFNVHQGTYFVQHITDWTPCCGMTSDLYGA